MIKSQEKICERNLISAYVDGELDTDLTLLFEDHLDELWGLSRGVAGSSALCLRTGSGHVGERGDSCAGQIFHAWLRRAPRAT